MFRFLPSGFRPRLTFNCTYHRSLSHSPRSGRRKAGSRCMSAKRKNLGSSGASSFPLPSSKSSTSRRVINAELRQPKDRGQCLPSIHVLPPLNSLSIPTDRQTFDSNLAATLTKSIHTMLSHTSSERGRAAVPLITNAAGISPFPIKMVVKVGGVEVG